MIQDCAHRFLLIENRKTKCTAKRPEKLTDSNAEVESNGDTRNSEQSSDQSYTNQSYSEP